MICKVLQGLPGSGKSRFILEHLSPGLIAHTEVCSADDFHMVDGVYEYKPENNGAAHEACFEQFEQVTRKSRVGHTFDQPADFVFVDNTNMSLWEMSPYVILAHNRGYKVEVHTFVCSVYTAAARNVHGVTLDTIRIMRLCMEPPMFLWPCTHVIHEDTPPGSV